MSQEENAESRAWLEFASRHGGNAWLDEPALYALPMGLIDAVQRFVPGLLAEQDVAFERDLRQSAASGFFLRRSFAYELLDLSDVDVASAPELDARYEANRIRIRELLTQEIVEQGRSAADAEQFFSRSDESKQATLLQQRGYAGWLATDATFRAECMWFCDQWRPMIEQGGFPRLPLSYFGEQPANVAEADRPYYADYTSFYCRWGLDRLVTPDLPIPMRAELTDPSLYHLPAVSPAGITLFVPWYLLREKSLDLYELARHHQTLESPEPLRAWLERQPRNWGPDRFAVMLHLYVCLELAIRPRYGHRLRGKLSQLDQAFAEFLYGPDGDSETVRKIRLEMGKRLRRPA